jgi:hypothetical protein
MRIWHEVEKQARGRKMRVTKSRSEEHAAKLGKRNRLAAARLSRSLVAELRVLAMTHLFFEAVPVFHQYIFHGKQSRAFARCWRRLALFPQWRSRDERVELSSSPICSGVKKEKTSSRSFLFFKSPRVFGAFLLPGIPKSCYGACYSLAVFVAQRWDFDHYFCMRSEIVFIQLNITQAGKSA